MKRSPIFCEKAIKDAGLTKRKALLQMSCSKEVFKRMVTYTGEAPKVPLNLYDELAAITNTPAQVLIFGEYHLYDYINETLSK